MVEVAPLTRTLGAVVTGVNLHGELDDDTAAELDRALLGYGVLVFPSDEPLAPEAQTALARRWGEPLVVPYLRDHAVAGHPAVLRVENMGKANTLTENWHFDSAYFEHPPPLAILAAQRLPESGGDTMWADQRTAHDALSPRMQTLLGDLRAAFTGTMVVDGERRPVVTYHPVVRTHPRSGRRALATGRIESVPHFEGMTADESAPILRFLYEHASQPEFVYRHRWRPHDVVVWDNRITIHYAIHDYGDEERLLHRITVVDPNGHDRHDRSASP